jgi:hypothetical protein
MRDLTLRMPKRENPRRLETSKSQSLDYRRDHSHRSRGTGVNRSIILEDRSTKEIRVRGFEISKVLSTDSTETVDQGEEWESLTQHLKIFPFQESGV